MYCHAIKPEGQNLLILVINWPNLNQNYILEYFPNLLDQFLCDLSHYMQIFRVTAIVLSSIHKSFPYLS